VAKLTLRQNTASAIVFICIDLKCSLDSKARCQECVMLNAPQGARNMRGVWSRREESGHMTSVHAAMHVHVPCCLHALTNSLAEVRIQL